MTDDDFTDGPADERCDDCGRLDPINCPCAPRFPPTQLLFNRATDETPGVLEETADERVRQVEKWGVQTRPNGTGAEIYRRAAEASKAATDAKAADGSLTWVEILLEEVFEALAESDPARLREELVQVAAVATSWVEDIDRKRSASNAERARREEEAIRAFRESEMVGRAAVSRDYCEIPECYCDGRSHP